MRDDGDGGLGREEGDGTGRRRSRKDRWLGARRAVSMDERGKKALGATEKGGRDAVAGGRRRDSQVWRSAWMLCGDIPWLANQVDGKVGYGWKKRE